MSDTCCNCGDPVGEGPKELPFRVVDGTNVDVWCPACFVYHRAPMEPARFYPGAFVPISCSRCGFKSVDCGQGCCNQCGFRGVIVLPPKPQAKTASAPAGPAAPLYSPSKAPTPAPKAV